MGRHGSIRTSLEHPIGALVLGHGAGGGVETPDLGAAARAARRVGFNVALVEQPYRVAGRRSQPPARQLDAAWLAVIEQLRHGVLTQLPLRSAADQPAPGSPAGPPARSARRRCSALLSRCTRRAGRMTRPRAAFPSSRQSVPCARSPGEERPVRDAAARPRPENRARGRQPLAQEHRCNRRRRRRLVARVAAGTAAVIEPELTRRFYVQVAEDDFV